MPPLCNVIAQGRVYITILAHIGPDPGGGKGRALIVELLPKFLMPPLRYVEAQYKSIPCSLKNQNMLGLIAKY